MLLGAFIFQFRPLNAFEFSVCLGICFRSFLQLVHVAFECARFAHGMYCTPFCRHGGTAVRGVPSPTVHVHITPPQLWVGAVTHTSGCVRSAVLDAVLSLAQSANAAATDPCHNRFSPSSQVKRPNKCVVPNLPHNCVETQVLVRARGTFLLLLSLAPCAPPGQHYCTILSVWNNTACHSAAIAKRGSGHAVQQALSTGRLWIASKIDDRGLLST